MTQVLWSLDNKKPLPTAGLLNELELEDVLCKNVELLDSNWLVIGRQVRTRNGKFLDLLCIDREENLIVVELKKELTPREVTAQVIEYASYMSEIKSEDLSEIYVEFSEKYLDKKDSLDKAFYKKFDAEFNDELVSQNQKVKMVIVASRMDESTEYIIKFLRNIYDVDINILFFKVFQHDEKRLLSRVWFEEENIELKETSQQNNEWNGEFYVSFGSGIWEDAAEYGFISAGGGNWYTKTLKMLHSGDRIWVNIPHIGYVGVGIVTSDMMQASDAVFEVDGEKRPMRDLELKGNYFYTDDPNNAEYVVKVDWIKTLPINCAVKESGFFGNQNSVCRPQAGKWKYTVERLKKLWNIS